MKTTPNIPPITCVWDKLTTLYQNVEEGILVDTDCTQAVDRVVEDTQEITKEEVLNIASEFMGTTPKVLQKLICLNMVDTITLRRYLACREIEATATCMYPQNVRYKLIGKRYGFSPDTVRRFLDRYPNYFNCTSVFETLSNPIFSEND